jgi:hypothetical protein
VRVPDLTVVVPVRSDPLLARCIRSVDDTRATVLVVLNQPTDEIRELARELGVDVVEAPTGAGASACEYGLAQAVTRHVLFMDSDCVFRPGTLSSFVEAIGSAPFVKGRVLFAYKTRWQRAVATTRAIHTSGPSYLFRVPLMVDKEVLSSLSGYLFDCRLPDTEDFHLTIRSRRTGLKVARIPGAIVLHQPLRPLADLRRAMGYGAGHAHGARLGLEGYGVRPRPRVRFTYVGLRTRFDRDVALYGALWRLSFCAGYWRQRLCRLP